MEILLTKVEQDELRGAAPSVEDGIDERDLYTAVERIVAAHVQQAEAEREVWRKTAELVARVQALAQEAEKNPSEHVRRTPRYHDNIYTRYACVSVADIHAILGEDTD